MKKILPLLLLLLVTLTSCAMEEEVQPFGSLTLQLAEESKTIAPSVPVVIEKYKVIGTGPDGLSFTQTFTKTVAQSGVTINDILTGVWTIYAEGYSANGIKIGKSSTQTITVKKGQTSTVTLNVNIMNNEGTGSFSCNLNFLASQFPKGGKVSGRYWKYGEEPTSASAVEIPARALTAGEISAGKVTIAKSNIPSGLYLASFNLTTNSGSSGIVTESIRIVSGLQSVGNVNVYVNDFIPIKVVLNDGIGGPLVDLNINGTADVKIGSTVTLSAVTNLTTVKECNWYKNGSIIAQGKTLTIEVSDGTINTYSCVAKGTNVGEVGSGNFTIEPYAITLAPGATLTNLNDVAFAPTGRFIVGLTPTKADNKDYKKSITLPYKNSGSETVKLYPIYMDQNTFVTTTNESIVIKDAYKDVKLVVMPESGVTTIGSDAFKGCTALSSITIPNSVTTIGYKAFMGFTALSSITIPNSVTTIGEYAFYSCTALSSVTIPNSVTRISNDAFNSCTSLSSITIGNSVTTIGGSAFSHCEALSSITIPNSVTSIGMYVFNAWKNTQTIYIKASSKPAGWDRYWNGLCNAKIVWGYTGP